EVQHRRVRAAGDDGVVRHVVGAVAEELRFQLDLYLALRLAGHEQRLDRGEAGARRPSRLAHPAQLDLVLLAADVIERVPQLRLAPCVGPYVSLLRQHTGYTSTRQ